MTEREKTWKPNSATRMSFLQAIIGQGNRSSVEIDVEESPVACSLGLAADGHFSISITCPPETVSYDDGSSGIRFTELADGYSVAISDQAHLNVAEHLFDEMIALLVDGHQPGDVARAVIQRWRELLAPPAGAPLDENALVGLYGELEVLEEIMKRGGGPDLWTGWQKDHVDFRMSGLVIEVKSTTSANYRRVKIHGLGQLDDPQDQSDLVLILKRLEPSPDGRSIPGLIDDLVQLGASRSELLEKLSNVRYSDHHRAHYEKAHFRFNSTEIALRKIDDRHPRLIPSMLEHVDLSSIDKIDYELNLNSDADRDNDLEMTIEDLIANSVQT